MKLSSSHRLVTAGILVIGLAGSAASGQLVTPPTEAPKKTEPFVMPPPPPPPPAAAPEGVPGQPQVIPSDPSGKPAMQMQPPIEARPVLEPLPDLPFKSLVAKGADGKILALGEPMEMAALKVNPTLDDAGRGKLTQALADRRGRYELLVIANLDLVEKIGDGVLETIDLTKREELTKALQYLKPLTPPAAPGTLGSDLIKQGLLTSVQKRFNDKIVKEYVEAQQAEIKAAAASSGDKAQAALPPLRGLLRSAVDEPLFVRRALLLELGSKADTAMAGMDSGVVSAVKAAANAGGDDVAKAAAIQKALASTTLEQRQAALRKIVEGRAAK